MAVYSSPLNPVYFPDLRDKYYFQVYECEDKEGNMVFSDTDTLTLQFYWDTGTPASPVLNMVDTASGSGALESAAATGTYHAFFEVDLSPYSGKEIEVRLQWSGGGPYASLPITVTDDEGCLSKTALLTYANSCAMTSGGVLVDWNSDTFVFMARLNAEARFSRRVHDLEVKKKSNGGRVINYSDSDSIYTFRLLNWYADWVHELVSEATRLDSLSLQFWGQTSAASFLHYRDYQRRDEWGGGVLLSTGEGELVLNEGSNVAACC